MHKLTIRVSEKMHKALSAEAEREGASMAELVRNFVSQHIAVPGEGRKINGVLITSALLTRLRSWCDRGQKIQAIKDLRMATGLGLKDAKNIIDDLWVEWGKAPLYPVGSYGSASRTINGVDITPTLLAELRLCHAHNQKIQAIRAVRAAQTPLLGLREAKQIVDDLWMDWQTE